MPLAPSQYAWNTSSPKHTIIISSISGCVPRKSLISLTAIFEARSTGKPVSACADGRKRYRPDAVLIGQRQRIPVTVRKQFILLRPGFAGSPPPPLQIGPTVCITNFAGRL